jgi:L-serine dehydratase
MILSVFDIFKIGIGPSSSHTVGPMRAANFLLAKLRKHGLFDRAARIRCDLYGSLGATGRGHSTDRAVIWGVSRASCPRPSIRIRRRRCTTAW